MKFGKLKLCFASISLKIVSSQKLLFLTSFVLGVLLAISLHLYELSIDDIDFSPLASSYDYAYEVWLSDRELQSEPLDPDLSRYKLSVKEDGVTEASYLFSTISVTCLVFPSSVAAARAIRDTWGHHCNQLLFFSHKLEDSKAQVTKVPGVKSSFALLCESLHIIRGEVQKEGTGFDWLLVTTDDTYALPENLRYYVAPFNSSQSFYLGHAMKFWNQVYNWGDAGYALSRGAVSALLGKFPSRPSCAEGGKYWRNGDWYLGKHMASLGVEVRDTRDHLGRGRFNGYSFRKLLFPGAVSLFERYWHDSLYLAQDGPKCCSSHAITFHGILSDSKMYQLEYLFHHLRPFPYKGKYGNVPPPPVANDPFFSNEEKLKNDMMEKWFDAQLMSTVKNVGLT